jgi:hypothetical protein
MTDIRSHAPAAALLAATAILLACAAPAAAQWNENIFTNTTVASGAETGETIAVASLDGQFLYVVWPDLTTAADSTIVRAMKITADGYRPWGESGLRIGSAPGRLAGFTAIATGTDLAVAWSDTGINDGAVFVQLLDQYGQAWFPDGGMRACTYASTQTSPVIAAMYGDLFVGWIDVDGPLNAVFANRLTADGLYAWDAEGRRVAGDWVDPIGELVATAIGAGEVGLAWTLEDAGIVAIYGNKIGLDGNAGTIGVIAAQAAATRSDLTICSNAGGSFCTAWTDTRSGSPEVYFRSNYSTGSEVRVGGLHSQQDAPQLVANGYGRYLVYRDNDPAEGRGRLVAQIADNAAAGWTPVGLTLAASEYGVIGDFSAAAGLGANVTVAYVNPSIFGTLGVQRFTRDGELAWPEGRGPVTRRNSVGRPVLQVLADDASVILFDSSSLYLTTTVHAQPIGPNGFTGDHRFRVMSAVDRPDDQGGEVVLTWEPSPFDGAAASVVAGYAVWARDAAKSGARLAPAPGFAELQAAVPALVADKTGAGWVFAGQVPAVMADQYAAFCPTFAVSTDGLPRDTEYEIVAYGAEPGVIWNSANTVFGWSEDNLVPGAPLALAGAFADGRAELSWQASGVFDEDLAEYRVYRGAAPGFALDPSTLVGTATGTTLSNVLDVAQAWYRVTAVDVHGNESPGSNEVEVLNGASGVGALPTAFAHRGNFPNPFNPMTHVAFDLPAAFRVQVDVYDAKGRLVRRLLDSGLPAGSHTCLWDGRDDAGRGVASGVYYAQVRAGGERAVRPMTLVR